MLFVFLATNNSSKWDFWPVFNKICVHLASLFNQHNQLIFVLLVSTKITQTTYIEKTLIHVEKYVKQNLKYLFVTEINSIWILLR